MGKVHVIPLKQTFIHFLNVGEGACTIIQHVDKKVTMIDVCCASDEERTDNNTNPTDYLKGLGIKSIFRYIQTHPDRDHMDGLNSIAKYKIYNFWDIRNSKKQSDEDGRYKAEDWECYQKLRESEVDPKAVRFYANDTKKYFAADDNGVKRNDFFQILSPTREMVDEANETAEWNDSNNCSYVLLYTIENRKVLFCGDIGKAVLEEIVVKYKNELKDIDVLVAPHHGRKGDIDDFSFLKLMNPKLVIMGNVPAGDSAKDEYLKAVNDVLSTEDAGDIVLKISHGNIFVYIKNRRLAFVENAKNIKMFGFSPKHLPIEVFLHKIF